MACNSLYHHFSASERLVQGLAKEWSLGCVKRAPRPEETRTRESLSLGTILYLIPVIVAVGVSLASLSSSEYGLSMHNKRLHLNVVVLSASRIKYFPVACTNSSQNKCTVKSERDAKGLSYLCTSKLVGQLMPCALRTAQPIVRRSSLLPSFKVVQICRAKEMWESARAPIKRRGLVQG